MSNVRVYRFGLLPPNENAELVRKQMRLAHAYRNTLTEIERGRRAALRAAMSEYTDISELESSVAAAAEAEENAARAARAAKSRDRSATAPSDLRDALKAAREARKAITRTLRERRRALRADPTVIAATDAINERAAELQRSAREYCDVYWGSYLLVEDAAQASRKMPLYDGAEANDPRFSRYRGEGHVSVQLQGGLPIKDAFSDDTRLRIRTGLPATRKKNGTPLTGRRSKHRSMLLLRIGSEERDPIWASWPMIMHRPIPDGSIIKRTTVSVRLRGPREEWSCEITVELPVPIKRTCGHGAVAIDLGWRLMGTEIRIGMWRGDDDAAGELRLSADLIGALRKADELRSIRDQRFNLVREVLVRWLATQDVPEWLQFATRTLSDWRSPARLAALAKRWRANRWDGDTDGYEPLEAWRYRDHHLWAWEESQRTKSLRHRREVYRIFAADLARKYGIIVLENFDLRPIARRASADTNKKENEMARSHRQLAAVSELRMALINAFRARGGEEAIVPSENTTRTCSVCGLIETFDAAALVNHACSGCSTVWDQDENATVNLLIRWRERQRDEQKAASARTDQNANDTQQVSESRWEKARRLRREKEARKETAREAGSNYSD